MSISKFMRYLLATIVAIVLILTLLNMVMPITEYLDLCMISLVTFILFTIGIYFLGRKASNKKAGNLFMYIIIINVFVKLLGSFAIVFLYVELKAPDSRLFIIPFLLIYFVFTIFETYFLSAQAQNTKP